MKAVSALIRNTPVAITSLFFMAWVLREVNVVSFINTIPVSGIALVASLMFIGVVIKFRSRIAF